MPDIKWPASVDTGVVIPQHSRIRGRVRITHADQVIVLGPSRHDGITMCTAHIDPDIGVRVVRGCFSGGVEDFIATAEQYAKANPDQVKQAYEYTDAIRLYFRGKV